MTEIDNVKTILDAGAGAAKQEPHWADNEAAPDVVTAVVPDGYQLTALDLAARLRPYTLAPRRVCGTPIVTDTASFLAYFAKYGGPHSEVFADVNTVRVVAVLDAPRKDQADGEPATITPAWGEHRIVLQMQESAALVAWKTFDGKLMSQLAFAELVEDRAPDFYSPTAADMLEVAGTIKQTRNATFESSQRLSDGQTRFVYREDVESTAGARGQLDVPTTFELRIQPWVGCGFAMPVTARLRTRGGKDGVSMGYVLDQFEDRIAEGWSELLKQITGELPTHVMAGTAPDYAGGR